VTAFEAGEYAPSDQTLARISNVLEFPPAFFFGDDLDEPQEDAASFRALSKMTAAQRDMALGQGAIALMVNHWIERQFHLPEPQLPDLSREPSPEAAAMGLRHTWGWGERPIPNMIHLLESKGVRVFSLSLDAREVDAFSMWKDRTPFVFLNTLKSSEHSRFDAAHELGHLVLHRHAAPQGREAEQQADAFASAFMMPRASVLAHAPKFPILPMLVQLKRIWIVSVAALAYRLHAVGALSDWHYRTLYVEIGARGYRTDEPDPAPREASQVLQKVLTALRQDGATKAQIADELNIYESELDQLLFGLVLTSLRGGRDTSDRPSPRGATQLKLIE
jgi:Zn-dependent peptidase ImmA (M78 family)